MRLQRFWRLDDWGINCRKRRRTVYTIRITVNRFFSATARKKRSCRRGRLEAIGAGRTDGGHAVEGGSRLWDVRIERLSVSVIE